MKLWSVVLTVALLLFGVNAEAAKRLGGGKSVGKQSSNVTQREAAPAAPAAPQGAGTSMSKPATPAAAPAAAAPKRPWGAMLGGLAAGLGLAWLAHSLGMGEGFGQILMFALLAMGVVMLVGYFMRNRQAARGNTQNAPFAFQGAGNVPVSQPRPYSPEKVGNDASARPFENSNFSSLDTGSGSAGGSMIGSALAGSQNWGVPAGFDTEGFLKAAKANFVTLQGAWDRSDIATLRSMMTDSMLAEIKAQLAEREKNSGAVPNLTEVVMIEARLWGIEELDDEYMASVEFSGAIREDVAAGPNPFREVWNMTKAKSGNSGWLVAGVQALQ